LRSSCSSLHDAVKAAPFDRGSSRWSGIGKGRIEAPPNPRQETRPFSRFYWKREVRFREQLGLPFEEMKEHACADADTALQLYTFLKKELTGLNIDRRFEERTMPLERVLMRLEKEGLPVDRKRLEQLRFQLVDRMHEAEKCVFDIIGSAVNLESHEEMSSLIGEKLGLRGVQGRKPLTQSFLEQLASHRPVVKLVVEYKRIGKQLRRVDSIIKAIRRGRVYPLLSQTRD
jgi:DNA polymerase I-like protein with 3'-5' exonuclease and polymerase domains